jgi:hypothetical protein
VVGFVLHQGPAAWNVSTSFEDLFDLSPETAEALLPWLPKFRHALLDLTRCDPASEEDRADLRMVLHLMKCAREQRLLEFFDWLAQEYASLSAFLSSAVLRLSLGYAFNADARLDVEEIYRHLQAEPQLKHTAMTVAEKLIAKGRDEGRVEGWVGGTWMGKLQVLQDLLGEAVTPGEVLRALSVEELEKRYRDCQARYDAQFRRP